MNNDYNPILICNGNEHDRCFFAIGGNEDD